MVPFFLLGFLTLALQAVLLRELFSVLYGSDLAFGFALASWTGLTALGAAVAPWCRRRPAQVWRWGFCVYVGLGIAVFLAIRSWGARDVIPFHAYLLIPLLLGPPCLLGGLLFPWCLADRPGVTAARAYGWEVGGGMAAGGFCALQFHLGGLAAPFLLGLALLAVAWAVTASRPRRVALAMGVALLATAVLPLTPAGQALECLALRLRLREGRVVAARNTPFASLVAVTDPQGETTVCENGVPWPAPEVTRARAALATVLLALPERSERALFIQALRAGFGPVLASRADSGLRRYAESDLAALEFARRHQPPGAAGVGPVVPFAAAALQAGGRGWDLVAVLASSPGGLGANRPLTAEFAAQVRRHLAPRGLLVLALPAAPGFTHPEQDAYVATVRSALRAELPQQSELRTQLGWLLLLAGPEPWDRTAAAARLRALPGAADPGVLAEALAIVNGAGEVSLDLLAGGTGSGAGTGTSVPPNRIGAPLAYFRYLQFRGRLVEDAPAWWGLLFRERSGFAVLGLLGALLAVGAGFRRARRVQGVFWMAWAATVTLIYAVYLFQSLAGEAYWALSLLSAASMLGILVGTRLAPRPVADRLLPLSAWVPALLFPLYPVLQGAPGTLALALLLVLTGVAGAGLGYAFSRRAGADPAPASGGALFAADLCGACGGLFLGGVLLPWWVGFELSALLGSLAATLGLQWTRRRLAVPATLLVLVLGHTADDAFQAGPVRAFPEELVAAGTAEVGLRIGPGLRGDAFPDRGRIDGLQQAIALAAAGHGLELGGQVETLDQLAQLLVGPVRMQADPVGDDAAHQQPPVASQEDALLAGAALRQDGVVPRRFIEAIEAQEAQAAHQGTKVDVCDETQVAQGWPAQA